MKWHMPYILTFNNSQAVLRTLKTYRMPSSCVIEYVGYICTKQGISSLFCKQKLKWWKEEGRGSQVQRIAQFQLTSVELVYQHPNNICDNRSNWTCITLPFPRQEHFNHFLTKNIITILYLGSTWGKIIVKLFLYRICFAIVMFCSWGSSMLESIK